MVRRVLTDRPGHLDVIDLGCGTGLCGPLFRDLAATLTGVDLSSKMIDKARDRLVYDNLIVGDVMPALQSGDARYDLAIATDVFIYIGNLAPVFEACAMALNTNGLFAFSIEGAEEGTSYTLRTSGRYAHSVGYIQSLAQVSGFKETAVEQVVVRKEQGVSLSGYIFVLTRL